MGSAAWDLTDIFFFPAWALPRWPHAFTLTFCRPHPIIIGKGPGYDFTTQTLKPHSLTKPLNNHVLSFDFATGTYRGEGAAELQSCGPRGEGAPCESTHGVGGTRNCHTV